jgi:hypothetical protein
MIYNVFLIYLENKQIIQLLKLGHTYSLSIYTYIYTCIYTTIHIILTYPGKNL